MINSNTVFNSFPMTRANFGRVMQKTFKKMVSFAGAEFPSFLPYFLPFLEIVGSDFVQS
jgi:hypothetical protein